MRYPSYLISWSHWSPSRRGVDQLSQLQADPLRQRGRGDAPARYRSRPWRNWKEFMMPAHRPRNYPSTTAKRAPMVRAAN